MNEIVNKFLLGGDKFMPGLDLKQAGFKYSACGQSTKNKEWIQKLKKTGDSRYIYQNKLYEAFFQHVMAYEEFKYLTRRTASDKILLDKAFNIAKYPKYDGYQRALTSMVYKFFNKKLQKEPLGLQINLLLKMKIYQTRSLVKNYIDPLLENSRKEKYTHLL